MPKQIKNRIIVKCIKYPGGPLFFSPGFNYKCNITIITDKNKEQIGNDLYSISNGNGFQEFSPDDFRKYFKEIK
jgi:hypothetical protein